MCLIGVHVNISFFVKSRFNAILCRKWAVYSRAEEIHSVQITNFGDIQMDAVPRSSLATFTIKEPIGKRLEF